MLKQQKIKYFEPNAQAQNWKQMNQAPQMYKDKHIYNIYTHTHTQTETEKKNQNRNRKIGIKRSKVLQLRGT